MGIEIHEWPPGAFEQATVIARSSLQTTGGSRYAAKAQLVTLIAAFVLPCAPTEDVDALADQVSNQPEVASLAGARTSHLQEPTARLVAISGSSDQTVRVWDAIAGTPIGLPLTGHTGSVLSVALGNAPDGRLIAATGSTNETVQALDALDGTAIGPPLTGHNQWVTSVSLGNAADGRIIAASRGGNGTVIIWDPVAGTTVCKHPTSLPSQVLWLSVAFFGSVALGSALDGRLIAVSDADGYSVSVWDALTGATIGEPLSGHTGPVNSVALGNAPDGCLVAVSGSGSNDPTVRVWDA